MSLEKRNGTAADGPEPEAQPHHKASATDYIAGLRRRRAETYRRPKLDCGCVDPWTNRHDEQITDNYVDGYRDAAEHLLASGLAPAPNLPAMRTMWKRGGNEQRLAMRIAELWQAT